MTNATQSTKKVTLLAGGVGAARLLRGLAQVVAPGKLTVVVNTGDDEEFFGLHVSPDLDTIVYTLADVAPRTRGWGIRGDTFNAKAALDRFYDTPWFQLGDRDLATNLYRTDQLRQGRTLSVITAAIAKRFGVRQRVLPATDDRVRTIIETADGALPFQDYLVRRRGRPRVTGVRYRGARSAGPAPGVERAIAEADVVVIAPSNPFVSIGPILAVPGLRAAVRAARERTVAVSPLIGGRAVKGPLAEMLRSMGHARGSRAIGEYYAGLAATLVVAPGDVAAAAPRGARSAALPRLVEHDILIRGQAAAERIAAFAIAQVA
jgi:LPPG:FO 2-phospho-L-lactate transferase